MENYINKLLSDDSKKIVILSGEGIQGIFEEYDGKRTITAIKSKLTKEKCHGDRFASAWIFEHENDGGNVYINILSGEQRHISDDDIN